MKKYILISWLFLSVLTLDAVEIKSSVYLPIELLNILAQDDKKRSWSDDLNRHKLIKWIDDKPVKAVDYLGNPLTSYSLKRAGKIILNNKWGIRLTGDKNRYNKVEIIKLNQQNKKEELDNKYILKEKHCDEGAMDNTSGYLIKLKNKKKFWLHEVYSSGTRMSSTDYTMWYDKEILCENEKKIKIKNSLITKSTSENIYASNTKVWTDEEEKLLVDGIVNGRSPKEFGECQRQLIMEKYTGKEFKMIVQGHKKGSTDTLTKKCLKKVYNGDITKLIKDMAEKKRH